MLILQNLTVELGQIFSISLLSSAVIIIWFTHNSSKVTTRNDIRAVQASHLKSVARIGGLSIMFALVYASLPFLKTNNNWSNYSLILVSCFPVFVVGFLEDLGYFISPRARLLASVISGAVFVFLLNQWLTRTDIPGLDLAVQWAPIGIGFSLFLAAGVSHAFNLIDGLNGLSSFTAIGVALSLAAISNEMGLIEHRNALFILVSAIAGFLVFNFPFGRIFLGDGGAYVIGHILIWMAILILSAAPNITPLSMLLLFFYPIADTLLAILRRVYFGVPISQPDRLHFHQLVMRSTEIIILGRNQRHVANPLATIFILPFVFTPMVLGILLALDSGKAMKALILITLIFVIAYKVCMWFTRRFRHSK